MEEFPPEWIAEFRSKGIEFYEQLDINHDPETVDTPSLKAFIQKS